MSFDGTTEEDNIRARMDALTGVHILDMEPDDIDVPIDEVGRSVPYVVLSIGAPFAADAGDRSMGDGEEDIPYVLTGVVGCFASNRADLNKLFKDATALLVGWNPNEGNATPIRIPYAYNGKKGKTETRPAVFSKMAAIVTTINLSNH